LSGWHEHCAYGKVSGMSTTSNPYPGFRFQAEIINWTCFGKDTAGEWAGAFEAGIGVLGLRGQHHPGGPHVAPPDPMIGRSRSNGIARLPIR
jgi:hypothetical protein